MHLIEVVNLKEWCFWAIFKRFYVFSFLLLLLWFIKCSYPFCWVFFLPSLLRALPLRSNEPPRTPLSPLEPYMSLLRALLSLIWARLNPLWAPFSPYEPPCAHFIRFWAPYKVFWAPLRPLLAFLSFLWALVSHLEPSWASLSWVPLSSLGFPWDSHTKGKDLQLFF